MCWRCANAPDTGGLTRRAFQRGFLTAAALTGSRAPALAGEELVTPVLRLALPPNAPRTVALTLDACSEATDFRILDTLINLDVAATIFITSLWLRGNANVLARLLARPDLFSVQNHGARHLPAVLGTGRVYGLPVAGTQVAISAEVQGGADAVAASGAPRPRWYRCATGLYSPSVLPAIEAAGFTVAGWSLTGDAGASLPANVVARRLGAARSGDVIIAHINQPQRPSGEGVAAGIRTLHEAGVRFVTLNTAPTTQSQDAK